MRDVNIEVASVNLEPRYSYHHIDEKLDFRYSSISPNSFIFDFDGVPGRDLTAKLADGYLVRPYPEARQSIGAKGGADRDIASIPATDNQYPADGRHVIAGIKRLSLASSDAHEKAGQKPGIFCNAS